MNRKLARLVNMSEVPNFSIYRGDGMFDFYDEKDQAPIEETLVEVDEDGNEVFRKPGFTTKLDVREKEPNNPGKPAGARL